MLGIKLYFNMRYFFTYFYKVMLIYGNVNFFKFGFCYEHLLEKTYIGFIIYAFK